MVLDKILRFGEGRRVKKLWKEVEQVGALEDGIKALSDAELRAKTDEFTGRLADGETLDDIAYEAFAVVRETAWRVLGQRPFDVQVLGGLVIHQGDIAEMRTGEGKTLTSTMPVYLNALSGKGVHVVTVNPYLASRDAEWMGQVYKFLGLSVGYVYAQQPKADKRAAYGADVTYGTNNELGFDYLRDHMVLAPGDKVQRGHNFVIVDEIDSILIDEARTPLIISGPADASSQWYQVFARKIAPRLKRDEHYEVDEGKRTVAVTEEGVARVEELLGVENLYENANTPLIHHLQNSLRAKELFLLDREYVIEGGEVLIVDENTGRTLPGRRYSEGLHQALEAKEGVQVKEENQTLATITLQNYFRVYDKLAGMTGTAKTEEGEFAEIYGVGVVVVPTNKPIARSDQGDLIYKTRSAKLDAVVDDIAERQQQGQPVLLGTISVEKSEELSKRLTLVGIEHEVLNAKQHFREAAIIAQAGQPGAVTVATNMAGRGVDIMLGGNPEELARRDAKRIAGSEPVPDEDGNIDAEAWRKEYERVFEERFAEHKAICKEQQTEVLDVGGLYVLGTERHESRRIDNQLRGRSGRQGDPGESRFYLSLEDDLMRRFNASAVEAIMTRLKVPEDVPIEAKMVTNAVARAQRQVEARNFEIRKNVLKYDDVMNSQRKVIYAERNIVLEGTPEQVEGIATDFIEDAIKNMVDEHCPNGVYPEEWDLDGLKQRVSKLFDVDIDLDAIGADGRDANPLLVEWLTDEAMEAYEEREKEVGTEAMREIERRVILSIVDRVWREHLYEMDHLRDGIGLRAVGQRDPLVEYQREAYQAFIDMQARIKEESARYLFNLRVRREGDGEGQAAPRGDGKARPQISRPPLAEEANRPAAAQFSYVSSTGMQSQGASYAVGGGSSTTAESPPMPAGTPVRAGSGQAAANATATKQRTVVKTDKVGRNDPCPCGSGLKYKKCHGA